LSSWNLMWKCDSQMNSIFSHELITHKFKEVVWLSFFDINLKNKFSFIKNHSTIKQDANCKEVEKKSKMFLKNLTLKLSFRNIAEKEKIHSRRTREGLVNQSRLLIKKCYLKVILITFKSQTAKEMQRQPQCSSTHQLNNDQEGKLEDCSTTSSRVSRASKV